MSREDVGIEQDFQADGTCQNDAVPQSKSKEPGLVGDGHCGCGSRYRDVLNADHFAHDSSR